MTISKLALLAFCFFCIASQAQRSIRFSQVYGNRCPGDRINFIVTVQNVGNIPQTVALNGNVRVMAGDGACLQSYASLGFAQNAVLVNCGTWGIVGGTITSTTTVVLQANGVAQFLCSTATPAGATGMLSGNIVVSEDRGAVLASGVSQSPQDTASAAPNNWPNYVFSSNIVINSARPF